MCASLCKQRRENYKTVAIGVRRGSRDRVCAFRRVCSEVRVTRGGAVAGACVSGLTWLCWTTPGTAVVLFPHRRRFVH